MGDENVGQFGTCNKGPSTNPSYVYYSMCASGETLTSSSSRVVAYVYIHFSLKKINRNMKKQRELKTATEIVQERKLCTNSALGSCAIIV